MSRRRELADAADGVTGRLIADATERPNRLLARITRVAQRADAASIEFNLLDGAVAPPSSRLRSVGEALCVDLVRHLAVRGLEPDWVRSAILRVELADAGPGASPVVRLHLRIVDDLDAVHTSTRRGRVVTWQPPSRSVRRSP